MYVVGTIVVIEMLVDEKDDRERHRVVKLVIKEWRKAKNACASKTMKIVMIKNYKRDATEMDSPIAMVFPTPPISEIMSRMNCSIFILIL